MPFFYWFQLVFLLVSVLLTGIALVWTRDEYLEDDDRLLIDRPDQRGMGRNNGGTGR